MLIPTGGRRIDFYQSPEDYGGEDLLIPIPQEAVERLLAEHDDHLLTQFGTDDEVALYQDLYSGIGSPAFESRAGWDIFTRIVSLHIDRLSARDL